MSMWIYKGDVQLRFCSSSSFWDKNSMYIWWNVGIKVNSSNFREIFSIQHKLKIPKYLEPMDISAPEKPKRGKKRQSLTDKIPKSTEGIPRQVYKPSSGIPNCCNKPQCQCDPGQLDDCLSEKERRLHCVEYLDPYQVTEVKELPENITDKESFQVGVKELTAGDLIVVGVRFGQKIVDELESLKKSGQIYNLKLARAGLAFEVQNEPMPDVPIRESPLAKYNTPSYERAIKKVTAEELDIKLQRAATRRKERMAERLAHCKNVVGKWKKRTEQVNKVDQERYEVGLERIERRLSLASARRNQFFVRNNERCRRRNAKIAELLEKRKNMELHLSSNQNQNPIRTFADCNRGETGLFPCLKKLSPIVSHEGDQAGDQMKRSKHERNQMETGCQPLSAAGDGKE
uniref:Uncharacterized protein n=1 Tax=Ciona savignyi TaxID=51511 RepID=H2Z046_CIOSA